MNRLELHSRYQPSSLEPRHQTGGLCNEDIIAD